MKWITRFRTGNLTGSFFETTPSLRGRFGGKESGTATRAAKALGMGLLLAAQFLRPLHVSSAEETADFYDPEVVRTLELQFATANFFDEIDRISSSTSDGYLVGDLTVDGTVYPGVGVRFRGNTSQNNAGQKRSFKIAIDHTDADQRILGYRTIKLNNAAQDPTFAREALYSQITSQYFPSPTANHVRLVINGQNWGIYVNVQQFNKDFLRLWYEKTGGNRFKAPSGRGTGTGGAEAGGEVDGEVDGAGGACIGFACGDRALLWLGSSVSEYQSRYELKSDEEPDPWGDLVRFCDRFNNTSDAVFDETVSSFFDVDAFLWQIALENLFADHDGYLEKGADYTIYQSPDGGRLHTIQHDANETFESTTWGILDSLDDDQRPVVRRLLAVPRYRQRYLAHARTVLDESFRWEVLGPMAEVLRDRIASEVQADTKKMYSYTQFEDNFESTVNLAGGFGGGRLVGLREFVDGRRQTLLVSSALTPVPPVIQSVDLDLGGAAEAKPETAVPVRVRLGTGSPSSTVHVHHTSESDAAFSIATLDDDGAHGDETAGDGVFGGEIPGYPSGTRVRYYVEARGSSASSFDPERAELETHSFLVGVTDAVATPVVINELMASNESTLADPQGEYDDWVELHNVTTEVVDLSGMYLSDNEENARKWTFPDGTVLDAGAYLLVWLDEDGKAEVGLHANFKLSGDGEFIWLLDTDARGNQRLDSASFEALGSDVAWGRSPDGTGGFLVLEPTPGTSNPYSGAVGRFLRGDTNADSLRNLTDAIGILSYLFLSAGVPSCERAVDVDDNGMLEITDAVYLLNYLFLGGADLPPPWEACGVDETIDSLTCNSHAACK